MRSQSQHLHWKPILGILLIAAAGFTAHRLFQRDRGAIRTLGQRPFELGTPPQVKDQQNQLSLIAVGDIGTPSRERERVIGAMARKADDVDLDGVLLLGDNFYESGVLSVDDRRFETDFEQSFDRRLFPYPFYACLGNHDYLGNTQAQVEYSRTSDRWRMPAVYYQFQESVGDAKVDFFVLDTVPIHAGDYSAQSQTRWLEDRLAKSNALWKIVVGHHPILSGGEHGACARIRKQLSPLFEKYGVDLYVSGHDHDLQLNDSGHGWLQLVSGAGSKLRSTRWIRETLFARAQPGFAWLLIDERQFVISVYGTDDHLFTWRIDKPPIEMERNDNLSAMTVRSK